MDDLLAEFLMETNESLDVVDVELVKFEQEPNNAQILDNIFRLVHTIKGTCGFLGLPRLESLAHAGETLMGKYRDGAPVTPAGVSTILQSIDRLKSILGELEENEGVEPEGSDGDLISELERLSQGADEEPAAQAEPEPEPEPEPEKELRPGEVSLDELERAFQEAEGPDLGDPQAEAAAAVAVADGEASESSVSTEETRVEEPKAEPVTAKAAEKENDVKQVSITTQSIRVNVDTLEHLMTMVSELVLTRNQLLEIVRRHEDSEFKVPLQRLSNVTAELQEGVMKTRMQPIGNAWQKLPRIVRDLANELDKKIELEMLGADTELDRQVLELIKDPLTHMVRNSADHGLETTQGRRDAGKPDKGTITLSAYHEGGHIIIDIADDGRGLNTERIKQKAIENGVASEAEIERMSEQQINKFIMAAGFSTAEKVTSVSGRGVGMDVVRNNIELIGGTIDVKSVAGQGSTFTIKIPLTLAIVSTLIVEAGGDRFAIPQLSVVELVRVQSNSEHRIERIKNTPVLRLRNKLLPLVHLSDLLGIGSHANFGTDEGENDHGFIVVMHVGSQTFGIVVDAVFHTEEIVVKPMASMLRHLTMFSGNTILGDGSVIMIIDPNGIASAIGSHVGTDIENAETAEEHHADTSQNTISLLLFRAGSEEPKAVPLSLVTRLEEFPADRIEHSNGRDLVQYRGSLMPLVYVSEETRHRGAESFPMLVFSDSGRSMGLVVDEIVDIVQDTLDIEVGSETMGILGSAVIKERATEVIDVGYFLPLAFEDWFIRKEMGGDTVREPKLLFIDDSSFFRGMLAPVLKSAGFDVTVCMSAKDALAELERNRTFHVIVSDIEMPEMSGFEFAEAVRKNRNYDSIPLIALSSLTTPQAIQKGREVGFDDYVAKFDRPGLLASIKEQTSEIGAAA